jgi:mannose-6-phosphate isomerase-like protein (cupin superfamily)
VTLLADALHLHPDGGLRAGPPLMTHDEGEWQLATFHAETDSDVHADHWEMHPGGDEAVCCGKGAFRIVFRATDPGADDVSVSLRAGEAVIVPRRTWHRLELDQPSDITSIAMRRGTRRERRTP